ncbi:spore coat protein U-like protein [Luteimonas cucumeris]|uniref:Spore coat protein U-like protein n=1 Tax=Luteimonas cucumeris TaxID=985012 RepID=A0A562LBS2_9GAMM|nr:spore coat U domain-containing protein [Luteimonas cucumeris]TWI04904.1 spore coat protein U-like protein [Luteimonas cucumeris]
MIRFKSTLIVTALIAAGVAAPAFAASKDTNFTVNINVTGSCKFISASNINFDSSDATPGTTDKTGTLKVQCTKSLPFSLQLDAGINGASNVNARKMKSTTGTDTIAYQLYSDSFNTVWGTATSGVGAVTGTGTGFGGSTLDQTFTVSARATLTGTEPVATYTDTIKATVTY